MSFAERCLWFDLHFAPNHALPSVIVAGDQNAASVDLLSLVNDVDEAHGILHNWSGLSFGAGFARLVLELARRIAVLGSSLFLNRLGVRFECRLWKSFIEIPRQNVCAIRRHVKFRIRLPLQRCDDGKQLRRLESVISFDFQIGHPSLHAFGHHKADQQVTLFLSIVVFDLRGYRRGGKPISAVQVLHGLPVAFQNASAECTARSKSGLVNLQAAGEQFLVEIMVSCYLDPDELVAVAAFNRVADDLFLTLPALGLHFAHC